MKLEVGLSVTLFCFLCYITPHTLTVMPEKSGEVGKSASEAFIALKTALHGANAAVPGVLVVAAILAVGFTMILATSSALMVGATAVLVVLTSLVLYFQTSNYGEATIALVAGLLTVFTVEWTASRFAIFAASWVLFSSFALIISSVRLAARTEGIYLQSSLALANDPSETKEIDSALREIARSPEITSLGPIERAEIIRVFAFRKVPIDSMKALLRTASMFVTIMRVDHQEIGNFVADFYQMVGKAVSDESLPTLDGLYEAVRSSPVDPREFVEAFRRCRQLVLSGRVKLFVYPQLIQIGLEAGVRGDEMHAWLNEQLALAASATVKVR